jgi:DNA-binding transcriptional ArsR family regulator
MVAPTPRQELFAALSHPLRHKILAILLKSEEPLSPNLIGEALNEPVSNVSYHVRVLKDLGVIRLVDKQPAHGSVEHFYRLADDVGTTGWSRETLEEMVVPDPLPRLDTLLDRATFETDAPAALTDHERNIVALHYGFGHPKKLSRREIGEQLGMSEAEVRTVERHALRKLQQARRDREGP